MLEELLGALGSRARNAIVAEGALAPLVRLKPSSEALELQSQSPQTAGACACSKHICLSVACANARAPFRQQSPCSIHSEPSAAYRHGVTWKCQGGRHARAAGLLIPCVDRSVSRFLVRKILAAVHPQVRMLHMGGLGSKAALLLATLTGGASPAPLQTLRWVSTGPPLDCCFAKQSLSDTRRMPLSDWP